MVELASNPTVQFEQFKAGLLALTVTVTMGLKSEGGIPRVLMQIFHTIACDG
jgi:hypothetical protein